MIHPAAAAGEDGDGPSMMVSANNGLWRRRRAGVDGGIYFRRCGVGGGHGGEAPTRWIVDGVVGVDANSMLSPH